MSDKPSLSIGQIVYILSDKAQSVVPAIVVEEVIVKKLQGNQVSWKVSIGPKDNNRIVDSNRINGELFHSLEEVRNVLMERFTDFVNNLCSETEKRTETWYGKRPEFLSSNDEGKIDPENIISSIEDKMNSNLQTSQSKPKINKEKNVFFAKSPQEEARERLKSMLQDDEDEMANDDPTTEKQVVKMPGPNGKDMLVTVKVPS
jgi:hypothetical protein